MATELRQMRARGESRSDFARVEAMSEEELERSIADDPNWRDVPRDWMKEAIVVMPSPKKLISLRLDSDVVNWFKEHGTGYQTRINAVLKAFVQQQGHK